MQNNVGGEIDAAIFRPKYLPGLHSDSPCANPTFTPARPRWQLLFDGTETRSFPGFPRSSWRRWIRFSLNCDSPRSETLLPIAAWFSLSPSRSIPVVTKARPDARSIRKPVRKSVSAVSDILPFAMERTNEKLCSTHSCNAYFKFLSYK